MSSIYKYFVSVTRVPVDDAAGGSRFDSLTTPLRSERVGSAVVS